MTAIDDALFRTVATRYGRLVGELGLDAGEPLLVLPNGEFFPDRFAEDAASVERLVARMQGYAELEQLDIAVALGGELAPSPAAGCGPTGCGSGACAPGDVASEGPRVERTGDRVLFRVPKSELKHPIVLTARLATSLGAVSLLERHPRGATLAADPKQAELTAVAHGFGVLLLEAAYLYSKSCGGPSVASATALGLDELSVAFALFLAREGQTPKAALAELGTTQRALLKEAWAIVDESPKLVALLRDAPEELARGHFPLREGRSFFARLFGGSKKTAPAGESAREEAALRALERGASVEELEGLLGATRAERGAVRAAGDGELSALVDEALAEARRERERERDGSAAAE